MTIHNIDYQLCSFFHQNIPAKIIEKQPVKLPMITKKKSLLTNAAIYGLGGVLMQVAGFILLPLYTHYLPPAEYGVLDIIEKTARVINICLMAGGIRQATLAFYLQADEDRVKKQVAASISLFIFIIFCTVSIVITAIAPWMANLIQIPSPSLLIFGIITVVAELSLIVPLTMMQARVESISFVFVNFLMLLVRVSLAVLFIAGFGWGIWGAYFALFITFTSFGLTLTLRELTKNSFKINWPQCREITRFSIPFIPTGILFFFLYNGDRFFLLQSAGQEAVGVYALGYKLAEGVGILSSVPLFKVWSAQMYETFKHSKADILVGRMLTRILLVYAFIGVGFCVLHSEVLMLLSDPAYVKAGSVIAPIVLANAFLFSSTFIEGVFYVHRRTSLKPITAAIGTAITLVLYAILIPRYSFYGAAYATLIGYASMTLVTFLIARRIFPVKYEPIRLTAILVISVSVVFISSFLPVSTIYLPVKCLLIATWGLVTWFGGIIHQEDKISSVHFFKSLPSKVKFLSKGIL